MGGGDLNLKKSWHPNTMKNQERVWKAEQKDSEEKRRIAELQREINAERSKEDMQKYAEDTGVLKKKDDVKLEWMYKGPNKSVNHEEYLLGKAVDKNFEKSQSEQKNGPSTSQDEEGIPGALRQAKSSALSEQVDMARKIHEDPLIAIRQRAVEKAKQLYNNPVKMKQIQKLASMKASETEKKKKKKSKKSSKKEEKRKLDALLTEKLVRALKDSEILRKLKKKKSRNKGSDDSSDTDSSSSSSESDEEETHRHKKGHNDHNLKTKEKVGPESHSYKSYSISKEKQFRNNDYPGNSQRSRSPKCSESERHSKASRRKSRSRSREKGKISTHRKNERQEKMKKYSCEPSVSRPVIPRQSHNSSDENEDHRKKRTRKYSDSSSETDSRPSPKKSFGLMMADGSKPIPRRNPINKEVEAPEPPPKPVAWQRKERVKLSDEEKERRRKEMLENASWRDKEREANVRRYRLEQDHEKEQLQQNFDDDFARKQFSKAAEQTSVESRIKSKLNTIQRSKVSMNQNFARR